MAAGDEEFCLQVLPGSELLQVETAVFDFLGSRANRANRIFPLDQLTLVIAQALPVFWA